MAFPINPTNAPLVDENGIVTPEWYRFFTSIWKLLGQPGDPFDDAILLGGAQAFAQSASMDDLTSLLMHANESRNETVYLVSATEPGTLTAGNGLTGGGNMGANITITVGAGAGITVNADDVALDTASTRNTDHASVTITAGAGLTGGGTIEATRTLDVGAGAGITVNANDVALDTSHVRNVDHSAVSITAGTGLSGGGTIEATRTINLANTTVVPGIYAPPASITVDQQGRITAIS